jgi:glycosyltransferase involved in cell wall biosynthesis
MNLLIITPLMPPAVGGGGVYTTLLANELLDCRTFDKIIVVTEKYPNQSVDDWQRDGHLYIKRLFPFRCGESKKDLTSYIKFAYQNLQFFLIKDLIRQYDVSHLLIHNYFHNYFSLMNVFVDYVKKKYPIKAVCDVRDPRISKKNFSRLYGYDKIICCSENVLRHFQPDRKLLGKLVLIPVIVKLKKPLFLEIRDCKVKYGLDSADYLFNSSGIYQDKGISIALAVVKRLRSQGINLVLAIAGKKRDWNSDFQEAANEGILKYLGTMPHHEILALSAGSFLYINLAKIGIDSMPRASLEAMMVGAKVLLPRGVPEFEAACPQYVANSDNPDELAQQVLEIIRESNFHLEYDYSVHATDRVIPLYIKLFEELDGR